MKKTKMKGEALYQKLRAERERLVKKYEAGGTIRYDEAIGLVPVGGNPGSTAATGAPAAIGGVAQPLAPGASGKVVLPVLSATPTLAEQTAFNTAKDALEKGRREKRINDYREDGVFIGTRVVLDLEAIKAANQADGIPSGTMMDALKKRAAGKTVILAADDASRLYGTVILGEVSCQLKLTGDIVNSIRNSVFPGFQASNTTVAGVLNTGLVHALPGTVEQESLSHRGFPKPVNYRGDVEYLKDPLSIWATTDASRQSIMLLGVNSEVRMWGKDQVIDLNGFRIGAHERPNRVAAFSSIIDLSDGHFAGLSSKGARNAHIYSSTGVGRLARNNHFAIRGHFVKGLLVEGVSSGDSSTINHGSYFGTAIFNDSSEIVFKDVHQEMLNKAVANSSMALSHYAQLTNVEIMLGYFERPSTWATSGALACPWMKWDSIAAGATDTFGNGKTTRYPVIKSASELSDSLAPAPTPLPATPTAAQQAAFNAAKAKKDQADLDAQKIRSALLAMQAAHRKSMKSADDTYIQVNTGHNALNVAGANRAGLSMDTLQRMTSVNQIPRSANLIAQNPKTPDGFRYPDSVSYGFRVGSSSEGVGPLASSRGGTVQDIYILDCTFSGMHLSPMETIAIAAPGKGFNKTFNGNGLRPFGYTNSQSDAASMAPATLLLSKEAIESVAKASVAEAKPVDSFDTAAKAVANYVAAGGSSAWTAKKASGLYKGNDVVEAGLAAVEAAQLLKKHFTAAGPQGQLSGADNSNIDIGVLALRKSMMQALGASTANHVGLKGGYQGDIFQDDGTYYGYGEIYPWLVKEDGSVSIDKDIVISPELYSGTDAEKVAKAASARADRRQSVAYSAALLPDLSDSLFKLKLVDSETLALVTADSETPVTYEQCASLLGFGSGSGPVTYKLVRNLDGQHHVHKGSFGVRIDSAAGFSVERVVIKDHDTKEAKDSIKSLGSDAQQVAFGVNEESEPESGVLKIRGVSINGCTDGSIEDVLVADSKAGSMIAGVEIRGKSSDISVESVRAEALEGREKAVGLRVASKTSEITVKKARAVDLKGKNSGQALPVEIESEDCQVS